MPAPKPPHFLFLQGMPSAFFTKVGMKLAEAGYRVTAVNLCAGDRLFWRGPATMNYRGRFADWPRFIDDLLARAEITDLILLGEQRHYHKEAVAAAKARGLRVTVTDFGYLRPDWITLEPDGMNGNSGFPRDAAQIRRIAAASPRADLGPRFHDSALRMAIGDLVYSFANVLLWWLYPGYRQSDRRPHPLVYFPATGFSLIARKLQARRARAAAAAIAAQREPTFVFPLQLAHDFQIVAYSPFADFADAIRHVLRSFAAHAPAGARLVAKVHPWDPGLRNWACLIAEQAKDLGIGHRVSTLAGGDLDTLLRGARGVVTVNSTTGIRALQHGRPVAVLGQAVYDCAGLTHQSGLDRFWTEPQAPEPDLVEAFIDALVATTQIRGVFFSEPGRGAAAQTMAQRLIARATEA